MTDVAMASTNGLASLAPQSPNEITPSTNNQSSKRKREDGEEDHESTKDAEEKMPSIVDGKDSEEVQRLIEDVVEILRRYECTNITLESRYGHKLLSVAKS